MMKISKQNLREKYFNRDEDMDSVYFQTAVMLMVNYPLVRKPDSAKRVRWIYNSTYLESVNVRLLLNELLHPVLVSDEDIERIMSFVPYNTVSTLMLHEDLPMNYEIID